MDIHPVSASHPRRVTFDTLAMWALSIGAALAALLFIPVPTVPFVYSKVSIIAIGALVALALYILARLTRGNIIVPPAALLGAFWLVPLAYLLSTLFSGNGLSAGLLGTELESDTLGFMLILAVFASLTALVFRRSAQYRVFFKVSTIALALVLAAQVIFVVLSLVAGDRFTATTNLVGTFADLGMLVGLGLASMLLAARFLELAPRTRTILGVLGGVALAVLALVNSPLIWILVGLTALGLFIEAIMRRKTTVDAEEFDGVEELSLEKEEQDIRQTSSALSSETTGIAAPLVVLVVSIFFLLGGGTIGTALANAFGVGYLDVRPSWEATFGVASHTYASNPLFGSGPGSFGEEWLKFRDAALNQTVFWNVDFTSGIGLIPTSFITTGLAGALAWIAFLGLFLWIGVRSLLFKSPEEPFARFVSITSFVAALYVFILAVFTVPGPVVLLAGFAFAGLFVSSLRYGGARREWGIIFAKSPRVGFAIVFGLTLLLLASVLAAYVVVERYLASTAYNEAVTALNSGNIDGAEQALSRSILFAETDRAYQLVAATSIARMNQIAANNELSPSEAQQQFQAALSTGIDAANRATQIAPDNYRNWVMLASVYQTVVPLRIEGAYDQAKEAYARAEALTPTNPVLPFSRAQLEIAQGNAQAAEEALTQAIGLKRDYTQAILLLSQLQVQVGRAREALEAAEAAAFFAPNDQNVLFQVGLLRLGTGDTAGAIQVLSRAIDLNSQYANARFFLAVAHATRGEFPQALAQLEAVAALSPENAQSVAADIAALQAGRNPFPPARQGQLGIPQSGVTEPTNQPVRGQGGTQPAR